MNAIPEGCISVIHLINWLIHVSRQQREPIRYAGIQLSKNKKGEYKITLSLLKPKKQYSHNLA